MNKTSVFVIFFTSFCLYGMQEKQPVVKYDDPWGSLFKECLCCGSTNLCWISCDSFPLHSAVLCGRVEDVEKLLNTHSSIDQKDFYGYFPIDRTYSIQDSTARFKITQILLATKSQKTDFYWLLARHIEKYHVNEVKLLLQHMRNEQLPVPPFSLSTVIGLPFFHKTIADELMRFIDLNEKDGNGNTFLRLAVDGNNLQAFKALIARRAAIELQNKAKETVFHVLASKIRDSRFGVYNLKVEREKRVSARTNQRLFVEMIFKNPKEMVRTLLLIKKCNNSPLSQLPKPVLYMIMDYTDPCCKMLRNPEKLKEALSLKNESGKTAYEYLLGALEEEKKVYAEHNKKYNVKSTSEEDKAYWAKAVKFMKHFDPDSYSH